MQLVYARATARGSFGLPTAATRCRRARVYATCTKESTIEDVGEITFQSMSEDEYYSLKAMVREARERARAEKQSAGEDVSPLRSLLGRFFSR